jgi:uroporphyrinogen-III synthase
MTTILITRPEPENQLSAERYSDIGITPVLMPFLSFVVLPTSLPLLERFQDKWPRLSGSKTRPNKDLEPGFDSIKTKKALDKFAALALTSTNALRALQERGEIKSLHHLPVFAVGEKTAIAARNAGFASVVAANHSVESLARTISEARPAGPVLYLTASNRAGDLKKLLEPDGIGVSDIEIYQMQAKSSLSDDEKNLLNSGEIDAAVFYSARTASAFINLCKANGIFGAEGITALCLSQKVAEPLTGAGFIKPLIAEAPNEEAMLALALSFGSTARK